MSVAHWFDHPWVPDDFDVTRPTIARVQDFLLLGKDNFAVDRAVADELAAAGMEPRRVAVATRGFLCRAVRALAKRGVGQFLDLGSGMPTSPSVDAIAREVIGGARVAYVDQDPVVTAHNDVMLTTGDGVVAIRGDIRDHDAVTERLTLCGCIDFGQPVAVLVVTMLNFISDDEDPGAMIAAFRDKLAPGSCLVLAAATEDGADPDMICAAQSAYKPTMMPFTPRTRAQITGFFDGFELLDPGVVSVTDWHPGGCLDRSPLKAPVLCGVGQLRK